jgi:RimJ/RimL family protein N-acetyltransferase
LDFGFNIKNHNLIEVCAYSHNKRALECYEKVGFKRSVVYRERLLLGREKFDLVFFDMLAREYFSMERGLCDEL